MIRKAMLGLLAIGLVALPGLAQSKPDFSGTWKLNVGKSDFGQVPGPDSETMVVMQNGANVKEDVAYEDEQGKQSYVLEYATDGTEKVYPADTAPHIGVVTLQKLKASWQGTSLIVTETLKYQEDGDVTGTNSHSLSADGKVLTMDFDLMTPVGPMTRKFVFDKADGSMSSMSAAAPAGGSSTASASANASAMSAPMAGARAGMKPNLGGTWKLNNAKSDFGPVPAPDSRIDTIEDNEPSIKVTSVRTGGAMGSGTITTDLLTDGRETTSKIFGNDAKTTAHWEGDSLVVNVKTSIQGSDATFKNVYTLGADGKSLTIASHVSGPMGEVDLKFVFDKQDGGAAGMGAPASAPMATAAMTPASSGPKSSGTQANLTGTWKLNVAKSDFGQIPPPDSRTEKIEDNEPAIKISSTWAGGPMGDGSMTYDLLTNGKETTATMFGSDAKSIARWDDNALVVNTMLKIQDSDVALKSTYALSADGMTLNIASHVSGPMGDMDMKMVYEKQP
jgi:hypothetical protein